MELLPSIGVAAAIIVGIITGLVTSRVMKPTTGLHGYAIGVGAGALTTLGLLRHGGSMSALLIPYQALGICLVLWFLLKPFSRDKKGKNTKSDPAPRHDIWHNMSEDPWAKEIREGGKMADRFKVRRRP